LIDADRNDPTTHAYFRHLIENDLAEAYEYGTLPEGHPGAGTRPFVSEIPHEHALEAWTGDESLKFLAGRDRRRPFFLQMTFQRPHPPWSICPSCAEMYDAGEIDLPDSARELFEREFAGKPAFQRERVARRGDYGTPVDEADLRRRLTFYYALITNIDAQIGRVLDYLRETGELDNTVIVYVADHGDFAGEHGLTYKNLGIYESIHRIPFLLSYPGAPQGRVVDELVESVDLYPTLCELMDVEPPDGIEGQSVLPVVGGQAPGKEAVVCEWSWTQPSPVIYAVRTRDFRLVYYGRELQGELYDRRTDPGELNNLYDDPAYASVRLTLLERILDHAKGYERRSDLQQDAEIAHRTRNMPTRLVQFGLKRWSDVTHLIGE
jgi:arylsulfatase A-like enzyme